MTFTREKKRYVISYYIADFYHSYVVIAENEAIAIENVMRSMPSKSMELMHSFKIERYHHEWN